MTTESKVREISEQELVEFNEMCDEFDRIFENLDVLNESVEDIPAEAWEF